MADDHADALLAAALRYAAGGLAVFPVKVSRGENDRKVVGPWPSWRENSTTDAGQVERWWTGPARGWSIGIDCGKSGLVVLDGDGQRGVDALRELADGGMPLGNATDTPGGGQHWYYREHPRRVVGNDQNGKIAPGVDVRGLGGFVLAPPSTDWRGAYRWLDEPKHWDGLETVPDVVIERMNAKPVEPTPVVLPMAEAADGPMPFDTPGRQFTVADANAFVRPKLDAFRALRTPEDHGFNGKLNDLACVYSHFVPEFLSADQAEEQIYQAALVNRSVEWQGEPAVRQTIRSGLRQTDDPWRAVRVEATGTPFAESSPSEPSVIEKLEAEFLTADQVTERPPPVPLVLDYLDLDSLAWLIGKPGSYKSFLALDWAGHIGQGVPWRGHRVHQGDVMYIVAEGVTGMSLRVRAWQERHGPMKSVRFLPRPVLANTGEWAVLVELARRARPAMVVLDTQARVTAGMEENSNTDMGIFVQRAEELRAASGGCVLIVHHIGRNGEDARGASALDGAQSTEIKIARSVRGPLWAMISQDKQKDMAEAKPIEIELNSVDLGLDPVTGRRLSSLVLGPVDPFETAGLRKVRDWVDNLPGNQAEVVGVIADHFPEIGATKAEIKRVVQERRAADGRPVMAAGSYSRVWDGLVAKEIISQVKGTQRYVLGSAPKSDSE